MDDRAFKLAVAPQAERVAVGINQVWQGLQLSPLILVMRIVELARIGALARRLDFDEPDKGVADRDRVVRARLEVSKRGLADTMDGAGAQTADLGQVPHK